MENTIEITTTVTKSKQINKRIELPAYFKYGTCHFWKIVNEKKSICVCYSKGCLASVTIEDGVSPFRHHETKKTSEKEFTNAYEAAVKEITELNK